MSQSENKSLVWLRRDLRLKDHRALYEACEFSKEEVLAFVFDPQILDKLDPQDRRVPFLYHSLLEIDGLLQKHGSRLLILFGDPKVEIPRVAKALNLSSVFCNEDYEPYADKRDASVAEELKALGVSFHSYKDQVIFSSQEVLKLDGTPYRVFTPYKKAWLKKYRPVEVLRSSPSLITEKELHSFLPHPELKELGFDDYISDYAFLQPGRKAALKALSQFSENLAKYEERRNLPADEHGTSGISTHLRFGTISIRECVQLATSGRSKGHSTWLSELVWRDFFSMILSQFPHVVKKPFHSKYDHLQWPGSERAFQAWCRGETGYPIVDAGMRQLNETGWMHNRVRMIVASFLVKDLLVDWRKGEAYFAKMLMDFDLSSNNGNWQWCASTGCDAQPYFRIFNPSLQSKRFDPEAVYIKKWLPELSDLPPKDIHNPEASGLSQKAAYPEPLVEHASQKVMALRIYKGEY